MCSQVFPEMALDIKKLVAMRYKGFKPENVYVHYMSRGDSQFMNPATDVTYIPLDKAQLKDEVKEYMIVVSTFKGSPKQRFAVWGLCTTQALKAVRKFLSKSVCRVVYTPNEHKQSEVLDALWHSGDFKAWNSYKTKERIALAKPDTHREEAGMVMLLDSIDAVQYSLSKTRARTQFLADKKEWYRLNVNSGDCKPTKRVLPFDL